MIRAGGAAFCCWPQHQSSELSSPPETEQPEAGPSADVADVVSAVVARRSWRSHTDLPALHAAEEQKRTDSEQTAEITNDVSKTVKETINEDLRVRRAYCFRLQDERSGVERGGAMRMHLMDSEARINDCISKLSTMSVEAVDYADATFYLRDSSTDVSDIDAVVVTGSDVMCGDVTGGDVTGGDVTRCRVASDGDILAPHGRPESGAFSESDVEWWSSPPVHRGALVSASTVGVAAHIETAI